MNRASSQRGCSQQEVVDEDQSLDAAILAYPPCPGFWNSSLEYGMEISALGGIILAEEWKTNSTSISRLYH